MPRTGSLKRRQRLRKGIILVSFLLFPLTIYYLSPVLIIMAASAGIVNGSFVVFVLLFLAALVVGRAFCGWACPAAGLQEACFSVQNRPIRRGDWIKYAIWVPWVSLIVLSAVRAGGLRRIEPFFQMTNYISISRQEDLFILYLVLLLIALPALAVGRRSFCHHLCWMAPFMILGRKLRNVFGWPSLRLTADADRCAHCRTCTASCPMSLDVERMVQSRHMEKTECILCGTCSDVCPQKVINYGMKSGV